MSLPQQHKSIRVRADFIDTDSDGNVEGSAPGVHTETPATAYTSYISVLTEGGRAVKVASVMVEGPQGSITDRQ